MTKKELIRKVRERLRDCPAGDVAFAVNRIFAGMAAALKNGERIDVRGFGNFTVRRRRARTARNPRSGDSVALDVRRTPFFKIGKELHERMNTPR